jgi:hypothetical protein
LEVIEHLDVLENSFGKGLGNSPHSLFTEDNVCVLAVDIILVLDLLEEVELVELHLESVHGILDTGSVGDMEVAELSLDAVLLLLVQVVGEDQLVDLFGDLEQHSLAHEPVDLGEP